MCVCVCERERDRETEGEREGERGNSVRGLTLKEWRITHFTVQGWQRENEAGTKQEAQSCLNKTLHVYAIPSTRSFITNYFDCKEREVLSKNYLLWVYYEKKRLTLLTLRSFWRCIFYLPGMIYINERFKTGFNLRMIADGEVSNYTPSDRTREWLIQGNCITCQANPPCIKRENALQAGRF